MTAFEAAGMGAADAPSIPEVLRALLTEVLGELRDDTTAADLETAARVLDRITERVSSEILVVAPPGPSADEGPGENRRARRRRRSGRRP